MTPKRSGLASLLGAPDKGDDELDDDEITSGGRKAAARAVMDALKADDVEAFASALDDFLALGPG